MSDKPHRRRVGTAHLIPGHPTLLFAYVNPQGQLVQVMDAETIDQAWMLVTGWGSNAEVAKKKKEGWNIYPATVEWTERRNENRVLDADHHAWG